MDCAGDEEEAIASPLVHWTGSVGRDPLSRAHRLLLHLGKVHRRVVMTREQQLAQALQPCPFCGSAATAHLNDAIYDDWVDCSNDDCCGSDVMATPENWNRRPASSALERDAARWQWLERHMFEGKWDGTIGRPKSWHMVGSYRHQLQQMRGATLRAAIDSAIAAAKGDER
jgi:hypothetical protein